MNHLVRKHVFSPTSCHSDVTKPPWSHWGFPNKKSFKWKSPSHPPPFRIPKKHLETSTFSQTFFPGAGGSNTEAAAALPLFEGELPPTLRTSSLGFWHGFLAGKKKDVHFCGKPKITGNFEHHWFYLKKHMIGIGQFAINTTWVFQSSDLGSILLNHSIHMHGFSNKPGVIQHGSPLRPY